ncbi:MAG TPA: hypothetical protein VK674_07475 [Candidatus Limnocylindria bacterium]|nr:hypothetical protein [Candidatus Limnocylindria bacterium]
MLSSTNLSYSLPLPGWLLGHTGSADDSVLLLRDSDDSDKQDLAAFIRSGDYFAMLATRLDAISDNLHVENEAEAAILQHIVDNLMYLDRAYKLIKK